MNILVAYASKRGSTEEIAHCIADAFRHAGLTVDCAAAAQIDDLDDYDAVVLGSAVYVKRWQGDARHFLRRHARALAARPFWAFSSGPVGEPRADEDPSWLEPAKTMARAKELGARGHVVFGGRVPAEPHGFVERSMVKNCPPEYRDRRDWGEISTWAAGIADELGGAVPTARAGSI
jgi:menaquinone-dependent protoporphyrinogen oxidase